MLRFLGAMIVCLALLGAQEPGVPLEVRADRDVVFEWRLAQSKMGWQKFGQGRVAVLQRPLGAMVDIRVYGYGDLFHNMVGGRSQIASLTRECPISTAPELSWGRTGGVLTVLTGLLAAAVIALRNRLHRTRLAEVNQTYIKALDTANVATLFRTDGSLPDRIGDYLVKRHLGSGGMAVVYLVAAPDGSTYALKLPHPQFGMDPEYRERFSREMRLGGSVMHPNVARILDYQLPTSQAEYPYYVMEYVPGDNWARLLAKGRLPEKSVLRWTRGVLQGLEHVHSKGIVHRDIKPENIVISESGMAKLMDFGIAKEMQARTMLTRPDEAVGTPAYMAPEQLTNKTIGPPTDLYAVGLMVYQSLSQLPFDENDLQAILLFKLSNRPFPPMERLDLPPELTDWVMKMLESEPEDRFQTAAEARLALERVLEKLG